jgi:hypothetical protein
MRRIFTKSDFMPLLKTVQGDLIDCTVGFVKPCLPHKSPGPLLAGSGTLVSAGGVRAILTAAHVVSNLPNRGDLGLSVPMRFGPNRHCIKVDMESVRKVLIGKGSDDSQGPDLGLLVLSSADWSLLPTGKIFFNLSKRREKMMNDPHPAVSGAWVICGMVGEWTSGVPKLKGHEHTIGVHGLCSPVALTNERQQGGFDYFSIQVAKNESYEGPDSFKGCSGGGLWHLIVTEQRDGSLAICQSLLVGVAFYESGWEGDCNTIECHGRKSIYGKVIEILQSLA